MANGTVYRLYFRIGAGILLVLGGMAVLVFGLPSITKKGQPRLQLELQAELYPDNPEFPQVAAYYPARRVERFEISDSDRGRFTLHVAHYNDSQKENRSAIFFPPDLENPSDPFQKQGEKPLDLWLQTAKAIKKSTDPNAFFITWWDNAQRIHWLTGRNPWQISPAIGAFAKPDQGKLWQRLSGGFAPDGKDLKQLGQWLTMDAESALADMQVRMGMPEIYFVACIDDLARLPEIATLTGKTLPFETKLFSMDGNIHGLIKRIKRWADDKGKGHYLVQQLPAGHIRAWRITTDEGEKMLLARLLPFTSSLTNPIKDLELVYRSDRGGYLSVYRWKSR